MAARKKKTSPAEAKRPRRRPRVRAAELGFEALEIEGGLLSPEWLARVTQLSAGSQTESDYRVPKGLKIRDEIGRYFRIAQAKHLDFKAGLERGADPAELAERFIESLLRECFGFESLKRTAPIEIDERIYPIELSALDGRVPVVIAPADLGLDALDPRFGDGTRKRTAFGLAQEYLNAEDAALWALTSNGRTLRLLRDNASLTRPAWVEADLERIFSEERYAEFTALFLLIHETRFGRADQPVTECALESWRDAGREEGTRAREHLRRGVEEALLLLGQGFLAHPENQALRASLINGELEVKAFFNQLLRLIYRLIFLLTVEERELLHPEGISEETKSLYAEGYGMRRLRERAVRRSAHDRFSDLWEAIKISFRGLDQGEPLLGLPALSGLFAAHQCAALDAAKLENRALLTAVFKLAWLREGTSLARVNWRDMGPEELGSVYESLLELVPRVTDDARSFSFAGGAETKGNARKTSGSYYTPDSLVQTLLDSALDPVIDDTLAARPADPVEALLSLSIVDPACGSGHFLLAAARRLAVHVARLRAGGTPAPSEYRRALRDVVGRSIYGVDLNPMAVELCKVALWMEALEPGLPLSFLDAHIRVGNALMGAAPELMEEGIPDAAWAAIEGDDKKVASSLTKRNKSEGFGQALLDLTDAEPRDELAAVQAAALDLEAARDDSPAALEAKAAQYRALLDLPEYQQQKLIADAWCAAFVWPKKQGALAEAAPTNELWRRLRDRKGRVSTLTAETVSALADEYSFFHFHLAFPQIFARGGFDIVLGNPPWERVKLQEQEFFANRDESIASAPNAAARKRLIQKLPETDYGKRLHDEFLAARRNAEGQSHFLRNSGVYPLTGRGDINTYQVFAERNRGLLAGHGRLGVILPTGIATDATTQFFFRDLVQSGALVSLYDFENRKPLFEGVDSRFKFCLLTLNGRTRRAQAADFAFFLHDPPDLLEPDRRFSLTPEEIQLLNPNTGTCPVFRSRRDAEITLGIYRRVPVLINESDPENGNPWGIRFMTMFHMSNDSHLFHTREELEADGWELRGNVFERALEDTHTHTHTHTHTRSVPRHGRKTES